MQNIFKKLSNLCSVKSIVTLIATIVFAILSLRESVTSKDFMSIFIMIIGFYFGTQSQKVQDAIEVKGSDDEA
jgi:hypothetical protein